MALDHAAWRSRQDNGTGQTGIGITNPDGSLLLENDSPSTGAITLNGPVNVGTQDIITGGTLTITGVSDEEIAGAPYAAWDNIASGTYVGGGSAIAPGTGTPSQSAITNLLNQHPTAPSITAASLTVNADFIDVNGLIVSGQSNYNLVIPANVGTEIQNLLNQGYSGLLYLANESTSQFTVDYDTQTGEIVVNSLPVNGGYVSLTGHIINTGTAPSTCSAATARSTSPTTATSTSTCRTSMPRRRGRAR